MNSFKCLAGVALLISLSFSCKKDDTTVPASSDTTKQTTTTVVTVEATQKSISKKWTVSSLKADNGANYWWFEFNSDNTYIIAKTDKTYISGVYSISSDSKTITLKNYGVMTITKLADAEFAFTITLDGQTASTAVSTKVSEVVAASSKTDLLSNNWDVSSVSGNSPMVTMIKQMKMSVVFSKYGTYFTTTIAPDGSVLYANRKWQWKDKTESAICYGDSSCTCNGMNEVLITELTSTVLNMMEVNVIKDSTYKVIYNLLPSATK